MAEKRTVRFVKWLIKVVISYAVFIGIGWLLGRIPAGRIGLSEDMFFDLRMFFMLFGPIYLSLIVKIVLTILAAIKHKENDTAEQNRGVLLAVTAILMLANLSNAQTAADLSSGLIESKGLKSLNRSKRYNLKGKRFLNIFLPIAFYMLILEISDAAGLHRHLRTVIQRGKQRFYFYHRPDRFAPAVDPYSFSLLSPGLRETRRNMKIKRDKERQAAVVSGNLVLETDPIRRKQYLRLPKLLVLAVCPGRVPAFFSRAVFHQEPSGPVGGLDAASAVYGSGGRLDLRCDPASDVLGKLLRDVFGSARVSLGKPAVLYRLQRQHGRAGGICLCAAPAERVFCGKTIHLYPGNIYPEDKGRLRYASEKCLFQDALDSPHLSSGAGTDPAGFFKKSVAVK